MTWRLADRDGPYDRAAHEREARQRATTAEEHLWCIALAIGPPREPGELDEWECGDGTPVDMARHLIALAEELRRMRK